MTMATKHLILGGQKSGKSRHAELLALRWLQAQATHRASLIATAEPHDAEMAARIARHQSDRAARVPGLATLEEPLALAACIRQHSGPEHLLLVDCLNLWLTNQLMPMDASRTRSPQAVQAAMVDVLDAITTAPGPVILISHEIGLGLIPLDTAVRQFVDTLGLFNQSLAQCCQRVELMVAGLPLSLKSMEQPT